MKYFVFLALVGIGPLAVYHIYKSFLLYENGTRRSWKNLPVFFRCSAFLLFIFGTHSIFFDHTWHTPADLLRKIVFLGTCASIITASVDWRRRPIPSRYTLRDQLSKVFPGIETIAEGEHGITDPPRSLAKDALWFRMPPEYFPSVSVLINEYVKHIASLGCVWTAGVMTECGGAAVFRFNVMYPGNSAGECYVLMNTVFWHPESRTVAFSKV